MAWCISCSWVTRALGTIHILRKHLFDQPQHFHEFLLSNLFLFYVLKILNFSMKSRQNVIWKKKLFCFDEKKTVFVRNKVVKLSFVLYECLRNIWMVPKNDILWATENISLEGLIEVSWNEIFGTWVRLGNFLNPQDRHEWLDLGLDRTHPIRQSMGKWANWGLLKPLSFLELPFC